MLDKLNYSPWLENLSFDWSALFEYGKKRNFKKGTIIYNVHDSIEFVYLVLKGRVQLYLINEDGKEKSLIIMGKNGVLGDYIKADNQYITYAQTVSDTILYEIPKNTFEMLVQKNEILSTQRLELLTMKMNLLANRLLHTSYDDSQSKVIRMFIHLVDTYGTYVNDVRVQINIKFTHQEIAYLIGSTRVTVANIVKSLTDSELIEKINGYYFINNIHSLKAMI